MSIIPINCIKPLNNFSGMPEDIKNHILSFAYVPGLQSTLQSSKTFSEVILIESPKNMYIDIVSFIDGVCEKLEDNPESMTKQHLLKIKGSIKIEFKSLLEVNEEIDKLRKEFNKSKNTQEYALKKQALLNVRYLKNKNLLNISRLPPFIAKKREEIIDILMTLSKGELTALKNINTPMFCKIIWNIAEICRKIPIAEGMTDSFMRRIALQKISIDLVAIGEFDRALEIANSARNEYTRYAVLKNISAALAKTGEFDRAIEIANSIQGKYTRDEALQNISAALAKTRDINRAIEVGNSIQGKYEHDTALQNISEILIKTGNIDKAIEVGNSIQSKYEHDVALQSISKTLIKTGNIDKAIEVANDMQGEYERERAMVNISAALVKTDNIDRVLNIANNFQNGNRRMNFLRDTSIALIETGYIDRAADIMNLLNQNP